MRVAAGSSLTEPNAERVPLRWYTVYVRVMQVQAKIAGHPVHGRGERAHQRDHDRDHGHDRDTTPIPRITSDVTRRGPGGRGDGAGIAGAGGCIIGSLRSGPHALRDPAELTSRDHEPDRAPKRQQRDVVAVNPVPPAGDGSLQPVGERAPRGTPARWPPTSRGGRSPG